MRGLCGGLSENPKESEDHVAPQSIQHAACIEDAMRRATAAPRLELAGLVRICGVANVYTEVDTKTERNAVHFLPRVSVLTAK